MRLLCTVILLALPLSASAKKNQPTPEAACDRLVGIQANAYGVVLEGDNLVSLTGACRTALGSETDKDQLTCAAEATDHTTLEDCGASITAALKASYPFGSAIDAACENQAKVSAAYAGTELTHELRVTLLKGCLNDMQLQNALNSPADMARKTACMTKATNQDASVRCWE